MGFAAGACGGEEVLTSVSAVSVGPNHACARLESGDLACWGNHYSGQLGDGTMRGALTPVRVRGITNAAAISADGDESCAALLDGTVRGWGASFSPPLGADGWLKRERRVGRTFAYRGRPLEKAKFLFDASS